MTNKVENVNSQLRDKISYLVRRTKAHAKSEEWLNYRLAIFLMLKILGYMTNSSVPKKNYLWNFLIILLNICLSGRQKKVKHFLKLMN